MSFAVEVRGIVKRFGPLTALDHVDVLVKTSTLHAVVGENGAGKTTLMRILYGSILPEGGAMLVNGAPFSPRKTSDAIAKGIGMVSQHYGIIPELTALQNLALGSEGAATINPIALRKKANALSEQTGFFFDWDEPGSELSPASAQRLEILKLLWRDSQILILDEPTAMLSPSDGDAVFESLKVLIRQGRTVILVTHRLSEVVQHADEVTVLRGGMRVGSMPVSETDPTQITRMIIGGDLPTPPRLQTAFGEYIIKLKNVSLAATQNTKPISDVSISVSQGEIVGVAGVDGSGQRELLQLILGLTQPTGGSMEGFQGNAAERIRNGLRVIPEDRQAEALIEQWSVEQNSALGLQRLPPLIKGRLINVQSRKVWAQSVIDRFHTKAGALSGSIRSLSGGNQQRFVAARALLNAPRLVVAFQPARGLDVKGASDVYAGFRAVCDAGAGALVISFDLDELLTYADRIVVMFGGRLFDLPADLARDRQAIGRLMVGQVEAAA